MAPVVTAVCASCGASGEVEADAGVKDGDDLVGMPCSLTSGCACRVMTVTGAP